MNIYHDLINTYFTEPVFKGWEPSEWDMKYKYNTPRRAKKIDADREKMNAKLQIPFQKRLANWKMVHANIDEIATYPAKIADLFLHTFEWTINDITNRHNRFIKARQQIIDIYGQEIFNISANHLITDMRPYRGYSRVKDPIILDDEQFYKLASSRTYGINFHQITDDKWDYDYPLMKISEPKKLMQMCIEYTHAKENDDVYKLGNEAYVNAIIHMSEVLNRILGDINHHFNGNKPTECLTDVHWGYKGEFNGILTDGTKKVSFKSFGAGGYNIQRFHYRFKITELV